MDEESTSPSNKLEAPEITQQSKGAARQKMDEELTSPSNKLEAPNERVNIERSRSAEIVEIFASMQSYQSYGELKELNQKVNFLERRIHQLEGNAVQEFEVWKIVVKVALATGSAFVALAGLAFALMQLLIS